MGILSFSEHISNLEVGVEALLRRVKKRESTSFDACNLLRGWLKVGVSGLELVDH